MFAHALLVRPKTRGERTLRIFAKPQAAGALFAKILAFVKNAGILVLGVANRRGRWLCVGKVEKSPLMLKIVEEWPCRSPVWLAGASCSSFSLS